MQQQQYVHWVQATGVMYGYGMIYLPGLENGFEKNLGF